MPGTTLQTRRLPSLSCAAISVAELWAVLLSGIRRFFLEASNRRAKATGSRTSPLCPPPAMKVGDFSGQPTIFDPSTTKNLGGGQYSRTAFPNNQIPLSSFDPASLKLLALFPSPTNMTKFINYAASPSEQLRP